MLNTIHQIEKHKIIVIVRGVEREDLIPLAEAMYKGGVRLMECTYDATGNIPDEYIAENIRMLSEHFDGKMLVGAGTVIRENQIELTRKAGGKFIISPDTNADIIRKTKELGLVSIPGALTPSEITLADRCGADFVKLFPIANFGVSYFKNLTAPLSHVRLLAVGGVNEDNMPEYYAAGAKGFGLGSNIVNKKLISEGKFDEIEAAAKKLTDKANSL